MLITATRSRSFWSSRSRRINSSVNDDLPAPPVPVTPSTGAFTALACARSEFSEAASTAPFCSAVISCANARQAASPCPCNAARSVGACDDKSVSQRITISPIMPASPMRWPSSGL